MGQTVIRFAMSAALLLAAAACRPSSSTTASSQSPAPPLSGAPTVYTPPPSSLQVNPPTPGAPPANAGDAQAHEGMGPGGPVNSPRRMHESRDGERG